jgi:hypothetical protein
MYSIDIREMSINIYRKLKSLRKTAVLTNISKSTIQRWNIDSRKSEILKFEKLKILNLILPFSQERIQILKTLINTNPFITMVEIQKKLSDNLHLTVSAELIRLFVKKNLKKSFQKPHFYPLPNEELLLKKTNDFKNDFQQHMLNFPQAQIISVDEIGFSSNIRFTKGWNDVGKKFQVMYIYIKTNRL